MNKELITNELLRDMYDAGLLPVYKAGFIDIDKQDLTIGINGLNQADSAIVAPNLTRVSYVSTTLCRTEHCFRTGAYNELSHGMHAVFERPTCNI